MFSVYLLRVNKTIKIGWSPSSFLRSTMINGGKGAISASKWSFSAKRLGRVPKQHLLNREELSWLHLKALEQQKQPLLPLFRWSAWNAANSEVTMLCAVWDARCRLKGITLRTVPTIVSAHTFCAPRDTRISYRWCLLTQGYFCAV